MTTAPGLTISPVINPSRPTAATKISARRQISARSCVRNGTASVAFCAHNNNAMGFHNVAHHNSVLAPPWKGPCCAASPDSPRCARQEAGFTDHHFPIHRQNRLHLFPVQWHRSHILFANMFGEAAVVSKSIDRRILIAGAPAPAIPPRWSAPAARIASDSSAGSQSRALRHVVAHLPDFLPTMMTADDGDLLAAALVLPCHFLF